MERLNLNPSILRQILNDREALDEMRDFLNFVIDDELSKNDNADCDLIDECINALEELNFENTSDAPHLTALLSEEKFLKRIQKKSTLQTGRYKKLIAICASAVILFAVSSVKTESGQTIGKTISNKIASFFSIEDRGEIKEESTVPPETETTAESQTSETTTQEQEETTTPARQKIETTTQNTAAPAALEKIQGVFSKKVKTEYKLGEELDLNGVQVFALYSDGNKKQIPLDDCTVTVPKNFSKDVGRYKITVSYKGKSFSYDVAVYAQKESVVLNSIYGTFGGGYDFKTDSFDDPDLTGMTVTAVYSDGSEKEISLEDCEITVEKNFMELENKALVTVTYEERSFSFVLTKEEQSNEI